MVKKGALALFVMVSLILISFVSYAHAVSITNLSITDKLNADLSMRETILLNIEKNVNGEFKLVLPDIAYNITLNGAQFNNNTISEEIKCENCSAEISYSFAGIIKNDSDNYTFYRKIDFPINVSQLKYVIILPENYSLFNISDLQTSVLPNPTIITNNSMFEWTYDTPQFPKEFGVRYKHDSIKNIIPMYISVIIIASIIFLFVVLILSLGVLINHKKFVKNKK
jgi:hypothetical protein